MNMDRQEEAKRGGVDYEVTAWGWLRSSQAGSKPRMDTDRHRLELLVGMYSCGTQDTVMKAKSQATDSH